METVEEQIHPDGYPVRHRRRDRAPIHSMATSPLGCSSCLVGAVLRRPHKSAVENWSKHRRDRAVSELFRIVPPESTILAEEESAQMFQAGLAPRSDRFRLDGRPNTLTVKNITLRSSRWDWRTVPAQWVTEQSSHLPGTIWLLDTGFTVEWARVRSRELSAETIIDEPGVLYLLSLPLYFSRLPP